MDGLNLKKQENLIYIKKKKIESEKIKIKSSALIHQQ